MVHHILSTVLALLMLMPSGICTCGSVSACSNHPESSFALVTSGCDFGLCDEAFEPNTASSRPALSSSSHQCPAPLPHHPSCRAVSPESLFDAQSSGGSLTSTFSFCTVAIFSFIWETILLAPARTTPRTPALPLSLAHCPLLI